MQNFITLGQLLLGEKYVAQKEKKKTNPKYSGHFVPQQRPRAAHAHRSDQNSDLVASLKKDFIHLDLKFICLSSYLTSSFLVLQLEMWLLHFIDSNYFNELSINKVFILCDKSDLLLLIKTVILMIL